MAEKEELKAKAAELGLDDEGTVKELKARIASAEEGEKLPGNPPDDGGEPDSVQPEVDELQKEASNGPSIGAFVQTENFNLNISEHGGGAPLLNVARKGWVGPAQLTTHAGLLQELIDGLTELSQQD